MSKKNPPRPDSPLTARPLTVHFMTEKIIGQGEDAPPVVSFIDGEALGVIAVFDGLGGAGSTDYSDQGAVIHSGAYFASRHAASTLRHHFEKDRDQFTRPEIDVDLLLETLKPALELNLKTRLHRLSAVGLDGGGAIIKSNMMRPLPTTMAAIYFREITHVIAPPPPISLPELDTTTHALNEGDTLIFATDSSSAATETPAEMEHTGEYEIVSVWAGDSRCYLLTPEHGLMQLSRDDLKKDQDAFENIFDDAPMSNFLAADSRFMIHGHRVTGRSPMMLIVATDGCFGFLEAPYLFEYHLLDHLVDAANVLDWQDRMREFFGRIAQDDASMAVVALGAQDFVDLQNQFGPRHLMLRDEYFEPIDTLKREVEEADKRLKTLTEQRKTKRRDLWVQYKSAYETNLYRPDSEPTQPGKPTDSDR